MACRVERRAANRIKRRDTYRASAGAPTEPSGAPAESSAGHADRVGRRSAAPSRTPKPPTEPDAGPSPGNPPSRTPSARRSERRSTCGTERRTAAAGESPAGRRLPADAAAGRQVRLWPAAARAGDTYGESPPEAGLAYGQPGAAVAAPGMYFDPESGLTLPQGVQLASVGRRIGAFFLAFPLFIVTLGIGYIVWGLIVWAGGQTPALQVLGMRCWRPETGRVPGFWWMALREVIGRWAEEILGIFTLALSFILMVARRDRQCLHDLIAGTVVLRDPDKILAPPA